MALRTKDKGVEAKLVNKADERSAPMRKRRAAPEFFLGQGGEAGVINHQRKAFDAQQSEGGANRFAGGGARHG